MGFDSPLDYDKWSSSHKAKRAKLERDSPLDYDKWSSSHKAKRAKLERDSPLDYHPNNFARDAHKIYNV